MKNDKRMARLAIYALLLVIVAGAGLLIYANQLGARRAQDAANQQAEEKLARPQGPQVENFRLQKPFAIVDHYWVAGNQVLVVDLNNTENSSMKLKSVFISNSKARGGFNLSGAAAEFPPMSDKLLMIPLKQTCEKGEEYAFDVEIRYVDGASGEPIAQGAPKRIMSKCD